MASNLSQVFVTHADLEGAGTDFAGVTGSSGGAQNVGVWSLDPTAGYISTALFSETVVGDGATVDATGGATEPIDGAISLPGGIWKYNRLQFVQGADGNPIASPIINTGDINSIRYEKHVASAGAKVVQLTADVGASLGDNANDDIEYKFVIRTAPTNYLSFSEPFNSLNDLSGAGKVFPLGAFNTTNHKVISIESVKSSRATETDDDLWADVKSLIEGNHLLNNLFTVTIVANTSMTITSRFSGVEFDLIARNITDDTAIPSGTYTGGTVGVGNGWQVLQDEKRCRGRQGDFNRMYFPIEPTQYVNTSYKYDRLTISYNNSNFATGAATGIAPQNGTNELVIYAADSATALQAGDLANFEAAFGIALATNENHIWRY